MVLEAEAVCAGHALSVHTGLNGLAELEADWKRIAIADTRYWCSYEFYYAFVRHSARNAADIRFFAVRDAADRVVAIFPVRSARQVIRRVAFRCLELPGSGMEPLDHVASSTDLIAESAESAAVALRMVVRELRRDRGSPSLLLLGRITDKSWALSVGGYGLRTAPPRSEYSGFWWIDVDRPFEEFHANLGRKFRANMRTERRGLSRLGSVACSLVDSSQLGFAEAFEDFLRVESSGWKGESGTGSSLLAKKDSSEISLYRSLAESGGSGRMEIHRLQLDGETIAALLVWKKRGTRVIFKTGYREEYAKYGPGNMIMEEMIRVSCGDPDTHRVDLVSGMHYLHRWNASFEPHFYQYIPLRFLRGVLAITLLRVPTWSDVKKWAREMLSTVSRKDISKAESDRQVA